MTKYYAGIGARSTPQNILDIMTNLAHKLSEKEYILRSGGALGADMAFDEGSHHGMEEIFNAKHATPEAIELSDIILKSFISEALSTCVPPQNSFE